MVEEVHDAIAAMLAEPKARVAVLASAVERYISPKEWMGSSPSGRRCGGAPGGLAGAPLMAIESWTSPNPVARSSDVPTTDRAR
jgi:hypothetical protein